MGSERFPGKMLKKISDVSLIEWVIRRVKKSRKIKKIILATTKNKKDDVLKKIAIKNKILGKKLIKNVSKEEIINWKKVKQ